MTNFQESKSYIEEIIQSTNRAVGTKESVEYINYFLKTCLNIVENKKHLGWSSIIDLMSKNDINTVTKLFKAPPVYFLDKNKITDGFTLTDDECFKNACYVLFGNFEILSKLFYGRGNSKFCLFGQLNACHFALKGGAYCPESLTKVPTDKNGLSCLMSTISCSIGIYNKPVDFN